MVFSVLLPDDVTIASGIVFDATAGTPTASQTFHVWNMASLTARDAALQIEVYDTVSSTWKVAGLEPLDRAWFRARVVGSHPGADPTFIPQTTGWIAMGTARRLLLNDFTALSARYIEVQVRAPLDEGAATASFIWRLVSCYNDNVLPITEGASYGPMGILTSVGNGAVREWIDRVVPVTYGTDTVDTPSRTYLWDGIEHTEALVSTVYSDQDSASVALITGEEYPVLVSQSISGAPTITKGLKALIGASVAPALPADTMAAYLIRVPYGLAIGDGNITLLSTAGRFAVRAGTGLAAVVGTGRGIVPGAMVRASAETTVALDDGTDSYLWVGFNATILASATEIAPEVGAIELAQVTTASGAVTVIVDKRQFFSIPLDPTSAAAVATVGAAASDATPNTLFLRDSGGNGSMNVMAVKTLRVDALNSSGYSLGVEEDVTLNPAALFTDTSITPLQDFAVIDMVVISILADITGTVPPTTLAVGDAGNPVRFSAAAGPLTSGTVRKCGDHLNAGSMFQTGGAGEIRLTVDNLPSTGGVVRVTCFRRNY